MYNRIWFALNLIRAKIKKVIGVKMTDWDKFIIEIGLD